MSEQGSHPVWELYDELRTARLNVLYYRDILTRTGRRAKVTDIFLALTAPSSTISAWWLWETVAGRWAWAVISCIVGVVAAVKPFQAYPERIKRLEGLVIGFRNLELDLTDIAKAVRRESRYLPDHTAKLEAAAKRKRELTQMEPLENQDDHLIREMQAKVKEQLPVESFYVPNDARWTQDA